MLSSLRGGNKLQQVLMEYKRPNMPWCYSIERAIWTGRADNHVLCRQNIFYGRNLKASSKKEKPLGEIRWEIQQNDNQENIPICSQETKLE